MTHFLFSYLKLFRTNGWHFFLKLIFFPPALPYFKQLSLLNSYPFSILINTPTHFQFALQKFNDFFFFFKLLGLLKEKCLLVKQLSLYFSGFIFKNWLAFQLLVFWNIACFLLTLWVVLIRQGCWFFLHILINVDMFLRIFLCFNRFLLDIWPCLLTKGLL